MARSRIRLNRSQVRQLLRSPQVKADLDRRARVIRAAAGDGYEATSELGPNRVRAEVRTTTNEARRREAERQSLLRALDAGR